MTEEIKKSISDYADCRDRKDAVISDCIFGYQLAEAEIENLKTSYQRLTEQFELLADKVIKKDIEIEGLKGLIEAAQGKEVEFAEWLQGTSWMYANFNGWYDPTEKNPKFYTTVELFDLFKSQL